MCLRTLAAKLHYINQSNQPTNLYRKFTAEHIFTGHQLLQGNFVVITNTDGVVKDIVTLQDAGDNVEFFKGLLTPGFINAHCHLELSHLKDSIPTGTGLVDFVQQVMTKRGLPEEIKLAAMQQAEQEMFASGIVAVGDICNTTDSIPVKQKSKLRWHNFIEVSGFVDNMAQQRLEIVKNIAAAYAENDQKNSLSPHAPYSVSKTLFEQLNAVTASQLITIHNQETAAENELYIDKTGHFLELYKNFGIDITSFEPTVKTSLQSWLPYFNKNQSIIAVHNTFTSQADIDFYMDEKRVKRSNVITAAPPVYFCLCINANKYIERKVPPINLLRKNNCSIILGTDSYASNWQLNMVEEMKAIQQATAFTVTLPEILQWATINGARALQMDKELGSFEKDKKPGIVLMEGLNGLNTTAATGARRIL